MNYDSRRLSVVNKHLYIPLKTCVTPLMVFGAPDTVRRSRPMSDGRVTSCFLTIADLLKIDNLFDNCIILT